MLTCQDKAGREETHIYWSDGWVEGSRGDKYATTCANTVPSAKTVDFPLLHFLANIISVIQ